MDHPFDVRLGTERMRHLQHGQEFGFVLQHGLKLFRHRHEFRLIKRLCLHTKLGRSRRL
jgi:hypothetical protein